MFERQRLVFIGDSVTDCGRREDTDGHLGNGYVRLIRDDLLAAANPVTVINLGISGNRVRDLRERWNECLDADPDVVTVFIGVNDMWRRYDNNDPTTEADFAADYRYILGQLRSRHAQARIVLMEPAFVQVNEHQATWRADLDAKIAVVRTLAAESGAGLVAVDALLNEHAVQFGASEVLHDGVHPTDFGHGLIRNAWFATVSAEVAAG